MDKWIHIKSNNPADVLALATVVAYSENRYKIVRRANVSLFFDGMENAEVGFYVPGEETELVVVETLEQHSWTQKCKEAAALLHEPELDIWQPYSGFAKGREQVNARFNEAPRCGLFLFPQQGQNLDLRVIDQVVRILEAQGIKSASCGAYVVPCIKGTMDLRQLVDIPQLCTVLPYMPFVITTEQSIAAICEAFGKRAFVISAEEAFAVDGQKMTDPNQIVNYINSEK